MDLTLLLIGVGVALLIFQTILAVRLLFALWRVRGLEGQLSHLGDALTLLTETTESGFRTMAAEVERLRQADSSPDRRAADARVTAAARRGQSVRDIAAAEAVSEGEVALRLHLAEKAVPPKAGRAKAVRTKVVPAQPVATPLPVPSGVRTRRSKSNGAVRA